MTIHQFVLTVIGFFAAVALVVILALAPNYAHAETVKPRPKPTCGTMEQMKASLKTVNPPVQFSEVGPYGTKLFLSRYNAIPPVSATVGDHVLIVEVAGSDRISIVVFKDGCIANHNAISRNVLRNILRAA